MFLLSQEYWEVKNTAKKGRGVFAKKDISPGTVIGDYLGILILNKDYDEKEYGHYDMYFNEAASIYPQNIKSAGVHVINHSCSSNCDTYPYKGHALYFANRYIFKGEELTIQYLLDPPEKNHKCNHICYCQSLVCRGTMHTTSEIQSRVENFVKKHGGGMYEKELPVPLGQQLPILDEYPSHIPDDPIYDLFGNLGKDPLICMDSSIPSVQTIRKKIRETGRILYFSQLAFYIYGIMEELVVGMKNISDMYKEGIKS